MVPRSFPDLVKDLRMRRAVGDKPPVLLLGAGASVDAGIGAMDELFQFFGCADFDAFCQKIGQTTATERYRYLAEFLQTRKPADVSAGYRALAALCAQNYFDFVLTTNMDPLLDEALAAARLWRRDYLLVVNGVIRPDRLELLLRGQSPRVKIVKLHGDLFQRFMAWTVEEMDEFLVEVSPYLKPAVVDRDFLVVGYSLRDARVRELVDSAGGDVWFTHPKAVPDRVGLVGPGSRRFKARVSRVNTEHPFGPTLLEVPPEIQAAGLRLDASQPPAGDFVQVAVAAGEKTGISSGLVLRTEKHAISIEPVGDVAGLVLLECYAAPGACGGPVVDGSMAVRGYIVAGTTDPINLTLWRTRAASGSTSCGARKPPNHPGATRPAGAEGGGAGSHPRVLGFASTTRWHWLGHSLGCAAMPRSPSVRAWHVPAPLPRSSGTTCRWGRAIRRASRMPSRLR